MNLLSETKILRNVDLNQLVILRLLFTTRSVSKTAQVLDLKQPAVSKALGQLREAFGDPLLIRSGNEMRLTSRAMELSARLETSLGELSRLLQRPESFDPGTCTKSVNLAVNEYFQILYGDRLFQILREEAPGIVLSLTPSTPATQRHMAEGSVDLAIASIGRTADNLHSELICRDDFVLLAPRELGLAGAVTPEDFSRVPTVDVSPSGATLIGMALDRELESRGVTRRTVGRVPSYVALVQMLMARACCAIVPRRLSRRLNGERTLDQLELSFQPLAFEVCAFWNALRHQDPLLVWLRAQISTIDPDMA